MKTSPNTNEERLPRASIELLPERSAVVARAVDRACRIAYAELVARIPVQESVNKDMSVGEYKPQPVPTEIQQEVPVIDAEVPESIDDQTLTHDSAMRRVLDAYEDAA